MVKKKHAKSEYAQRCVCFINVQSSLHENVIFSVCARMGNAEYIMWNSIKIRLKTPETKFLSVSLLSQAQNT